MNSVVLVESQGSCALVRIVRLQKFDRRDNMIFTVHLNRLIDENTPLGQSTIETCLQEAYKYQKVTKISCDIGSRFEASWLDCVTMMSEMTIAVIVVSASCHHLTRADSGWSRISWFSRVTLPWLRGGTSVAPWRHECSHVPVFRRLFDRLPVQISTSDLHHRILRKKLYHIRAYDFGVQFSFNLGNPICNLARKEQENGTDKCLYCHVDPQLSRKFASLHGAHLYSKLQKQPFFGLSHISKVNVDFFRRNILALLTSEKIN